MQRFFYFFFVLLLSAVAHADGQIFGGTPPSIKWNQIDSFPARIIFPNGMEKEAAEVAFLVSSLNERTRSTLGDRQHRIDIVFHNLTTISNAYVQLAPFRSEFQLTPSQNSFDLGSLPWHQTLAIHEYRHVQQYNNFRVGLSKAFYYLFGEEGLALANNLSVPNWFWEGDAVYQETLVSKQGRGRLPLFLTGYFSLWLSGKNYSWMKLRNGSLRDYTPDHYPLGYMMVAYGREKYGADFWRKTAVDAAAFKGLFYPLQSSIFKHTGISFRQYRKQAFAYFRDQLPAEAYGDTNAAYGRQHPHFAADETFPQFIDSNRVVFLKTTYRQPPRFVETDLNNHLEKRIRYRAVSSDDQFSFRNGQIAYSAYEPDLRWGWRNYSVIRVLDMNTGKDKRLTSKTKYFSPDISPDGKWIAAVAYPEAAHACLDILESKSGKMILRLPNPENLFYTYPKFFTSQQLVTAVRNSRGEMCLMMLDLPAGTQTQLSAWSMNPVGFLSVQNGDIYFTQTDSGLDKGFRMKAGEIFPMLDQPVTGTYQFSAGFGKYVWTSFTAVGYHLNIVKDSSLFSGESIRLNEEEPLQTHRIFSLDHPPFRIPDTIPALSYPVKPYVSTTDIFHFHSWRPYINDPDYRFSLVGENVLNTFQSEVYVGYNRNEQYKKLGLDLNYGGLFPYFNAGAEYLIDRNGYLRNAQKIYWNELETYAGSSVPLNFSKGRWLTNLEPGASFAYHQQFFKGIYKDSLVNRAFSSIDPAISFSNQLQQGKQQIFPSFAQVLLFQYDRAVTGLQGNQFLASGNFYFPGLISTHSLEIRAALQQRDSLNQIRFNNSFPFSRGYSGENFYRMYRLAINYHFPLAYPDWGFGNILYFLRIRANVFFDYTRVPSFSNNSPDVELQYRSLGMELYFDTSWWNELPLSLGIRYSRLLDRDYEGRGPNQWELILPLNLLDQGFSHRNSNL
ncbi:MAG: hypothetical protein Q8918_02750 [Bacteroidota bacterium]|nr:hypothetical protein [Bacteroidota bacterium]MDP4249009.1 hypothetical protein [Bacteroidota bacterium]